MAVVIASVFSKTAPFDRRRVSIPGADRSAVCLLKGVSGPTLKKRRRYDGNGGFLNIDGPTRGVLRIVEKTIADFETIREKIVERGRRPMVERACEQLTLRSRQGKASEGEKHSVVITSQFCGLRYPNSLNWNCVFLSDPLKIAVTPDTRCPNILPPNSVGT
jgi:hypothetical protein